MVRGLCVIRIVLVSILLCAGMHGAGAAEVHPNGLHAEVQLFIPPGGPADPYGAPMGVQVGYTRYGLPLGLSVGTTVSVALYYPRLEGFGASQTVEWGAVLGYPVPIRLGHDAVVLVGPRIGGGLYHRWFAYQGAWNYSSRPVVSLSIGADLATGSRWRIGLVIRGVLIVDNDVRLTGAIGERVGVAF
jgi:hypothetical protein